MNVALLPEHKPQRPSPYRVPKEEHEHTEDNRMRHIVVGSDLALVIDLFLRR